jgi:hypothetical protein
MDSTTNQSGTGLSYGLIAGVIICIITLLQYLGGLDMYFSPVSYVSYLVVVTMAVVAALKVRQKNEGFLEFRDALKITFAVFAMSLLLQTIFNYVLFNFVDTDFRDEVSQEALNRTEQWLRRFESSESRIEEQIESERNKNQFSFRRVMLGYAGTCIIAFIFCLLISVIVKRSKPAFNNI